MHLKMMVFQTSSHSVANVLLLLYLISIILNQKTGKTVQQKTSISRKLLDQQHDFVPANSTEIQFLGRWLASLDKAQRFTAYPGSSLYLTVDNTTSVVMNFAQKHHQLNHNLVQHRESIPFYAQEQESLNHVHVDHHINLFVEINGRGTKYINTAEDEMIELTSNLSSNTRHNIRITLLQGKCYGASVLGVAGFWITKGSVLVTERGLSTTALDHETTSRRPVHVSKKASRQQGSSSEHNQPAVIEFFSSVIVPASILDNESSRSASLHERAQSIETTSLTLDSDMHLSSVSVPPFLCLTRVCASHQSPELASSISTMSDLYFRTGPPGSPYFEIPWPALLQVAADNMSLTPSVIILDVGFWDFFLFLSDKSHQTSRSLNTFISQFVEAYVKFVLTIRRNMPHRELFLQKFEHYFDPPYLYNSAPSTLPILLLATSFPQTTGLNINTILHNALEKVVSTLHKQEGDIHTHLIDTSGWFSKQDFQATHTTFHHPGSRHKANLTASIPRLNRQGHTRLRNFLKYHVCPFLTSPPPSSSRRQKQQKQQQQQQRHSVTNEERPRPGCAFDIPSVYEGELYVPQEANVAKILEEKKIEKIKTLFGEVAPIRA